MHRTSCHSASRLLLPAVSLFALSLLPADASAQGLLGRMKKAAQQAAAEAATRKVGDAARAGTEKTADAVTGKAGEMVTGRKPAADTTTTVGAGDRGGAGATDVPVPGAGAWTNYDYVPGTRVLYADDFSSETVGNFPRRLEHRSGAAEVVEWQGRRWLSSSGADAVVITLPEVLPERFTLEFDLAGQGNPMLVHFDGRTSVSGGAAASDYLEFGTYFAGVKGPTRSGTSPSGRDTKKQVVRARVMVDGAYVKVFIDEKRVANIPNANLGRSKQIQLLLNGWDAEHPRLIGDVRVAAGGRRLYEALAETGRVTTQGILFAIGSATLRPESTPTLLEIAGMLVDHPTLQLTIEGHTDAVGDAAANQALSDARAQAVKSALVSSYGADASRLEARGYGASKPVAPNTTAEGRASNRRVELVRR